VILRAAFWSLGAVLLLGMGHTSAEPTLAPKAPTAPEGVVACRPPAPSGELPADPFQACAEKVVAGVYPCSPEKLAVYRRGLAAGVTVKGRVFLTAYYPWEGRDGRIDCRGNTCTPLTCSANRLAYGTWVWIEEPCGLRKVLDRGARSLNRAADRRGCDLWIDLWMTRGMDTHTTRYAVLDIR
jgi:hypothetical protein